MEQWKEVPAAPRYEISTEGRIRRVIQQPILRAFNGRKGHKRIGLWVNGVRRKFAVHRLVLLAFVGPSSLEVNHKNGITSDNRLENLEYVTGEENRSHALHVLLKKRGPDKKKRKPGSGIYKRPSKKRAGHR